MSQVTRVHANILLSVPDAGIAVITIDRPRARNALDLETNRAMFELLGELGTRDGLRALVIAGGGDKAFVSGADIAELAKRTRDDAWPAWNAELCDAVERFPRPVVAAVRGFALGGGCELALACDLRVAGESARFGFPEVTLGIIPGAGGTTRLWRMVGMGFAKEMILTGRIVDAHEAAAKGLVNRVVEDEEVLDTALEFARVLAQNSPLALRIGKLLLNAAPEVSAAQGRTMESLAQATLYDSADKNTRMQAFLQRGKPGR